MNELDIKKTAQLMEAGREKAPQGEQPPLTTRARVILYGTILSLGSLVANGFRLETERTDALEALKITEPFTSLDFEGTFGLKEVISVRKSAPVPMNAPIAAEYLTALLVKNNPSLVIAREGEYRLKVDEQGAYIPDRRVQLLQQLVMGAPHADGLLGAKTARAFRLALTEAKKMGFSSDESPLKEPFSLNVGMAEALISYAMTRSQEARVTFQTALEEQGYMLGSSGRDGKLGPITELAAGRLQLDRGLPVQSFTLTPQAVAAALEGLPTLRHTLKEELQQSSWFSRLPKGWQSHLEKLSAELSPENIAAFRLLLTSPGFQEICEGRPTDGVVSLSSERVIDLQCKLVQVFSLSDLEGRCHLVNLAHRSIFQGHGSVLFDICGERDKSGREKFLLDYLYDLSVDPFAPRDQPHRISILNGALAELDPFNINQGKWGRCGGDVIHFDLSLRYPARALSLVVKGFSLEKAGEDTSPGPKPILQEDGYTPGESISPTEARIHAYFMELGDQQYYYSPSKDCQVDPVTGARKWAGLFDRDIARLATEITGAKHVCYSQDQGIDRAALVLLLRAAEPGDKFSYLSRYYTPQEMLELSPEERRGRDQIRIGHIVNFVSFDEVQGEVLFRTWGRAPAEAGSWIESTDGSLRKRVVDQERGIYAVRIAEDLEPVISGVILREKKATPSPEKIDFPWKFPQLIPFVGG